MTEDATLSAWCPISSDMLSTPHACARQCLAHAMAPRDAVVSSAAAQRLYKLMLLVREVRVTHFLLSPLSSRVPADGHGGVQSGSLSLLISAMSV